MLGGGGGGGRKRKAGGSDAGDEGGDDDDPDFVMGACVCVLCVCRMYGKMHNAMRGVCRLCQTDGVCVSNRCSFPAGGGKRPRSKRDWEPAAGGPEHKAAMLMERARTQQERLDAQIRKVWRR